MKIKTIVLIMTSLLIVYTFTSCSQLSNESANTSIDGEIDNPTHYDTIYSAYMDSNEWRKVNKEDSQYDTDFEMDSIEIESFNIFDFDNDGVPELYFLAGSPEFEGNSREELSKFCTIVDDNVKTLLTGYISRGTIGGSTVNIRQDKETSQHVVGLTGHSGGFGGNSSWVEYYSYKKTVIKKIIQFSTISQIESQYEDVELQDPSLYYVEEETPFESSNGESYITIYKVNNKQVSLEEFNNVKNRFVEPKDEDFIVK